ncbi:hypothetical protein L3X38_031041 [Prunus dulcis]|uniref:Uncharacterized protein n=1 Tax=Prunus dulcis TaxID=3755 RepID=A0AAD4YUL1_PRUDU|nr:hypothetical protein L3X38_031041 [Prunus dulcis]
MLHGIPALQLLEPTGKLMIYCTRSSLSTEHNFPISHQPSMTKLLILFNCSGVKSCTSAAAAPVAAATASVPLPHRFHDLPPRPRHIQHKPDQEPPQPPPSPKKCAVMRLFKD